MANILEYTAPAAVPEPTDMAATTAREAGRVKDIFARESARVLGGAISHVGSQVGEKIDRHVTAQTISHGAATYSSKFSELTQNWNEYANKSDPNDTSIMQGFREKVLEPWINDEWLKGFEGAPAKAQAWALSRADELRQHFSTKMSADMATRAGQAVHENINALERNYSNTLMEDPSALSHITDTIKMDVAAIVEANPYLSSSDGARVKAELIPKLTASVGKAAFYGMAKANPQEAKQALVRGDFNDYFDAHERVRAETFANEVITQKRVEAEHTRVTQDRELKKAQQEQADSYIRKILTGQSIKGYETDLGITGAERENIANFAHSHLMQLRDRKENTPHPVTYRAVLQGMFDQAESDPNNLSIKPIRDAFASGRLNPREEAELEQRFNALDKPLERNFAKQIAVAERSMRSSIFGNIMVQTEPDKFTGIVNQLEKDAHDKLDAERKKPNGDVNKLLDPQSPDYLFAPGVIRSYLTPTKKVIGDQADAERRQIDIAAERNLVAAAISGGVPEAAAKARFRERTGQDFSAASSATETPASINPTALKIVNPQSYTEFEAQQEALRPAIEAKGWKWEPDRWNYSVDDNGQLQRELSPGRIWLKANFAAIMAHRKSME